MVWYGDTKLNHRVNYIIFPWELVHYICSLFYPILSLCASERAEAYPSCLACAFKFQKESATNLGFISKIPLLGFGDADDHIVE